jgi:hypothetical protein
MGVSLKRKWLREQKRTGGKDRRYCFLSQPHGSTKAQGRMDLAVVGNGRKLLNQDNKEFFSKDVNGTGTTSG